MHSITGGKDQTLSLLSTGEVLAWGGAGSGRYTPPFADICRAAKDADVKPVYVSIPAGFTHISAGYGVSLGISNQHQLFVWGFCQLGIGGVDKFSEEPTLVSGIDKAGWDTVVVGDAFDPAGITTVFTVNPSNVVIVTSLNYNANFKVEVWLNESSQAQNVTNQNVSGKFGFTIPEIVVAGTRIRYTVFATYVEQRQAVSKALRKIKPEADQ